MDLWTQQTVSRFVKDVGPVDSLFQTVIALEDDGTNEVSVEENEEPESKWSWTTACSYRSLLVMKLNYP
ncbi:hypothetical protein JG688_00002511 [Phytophthora aleatoria]|uniref:Uncharacterized protein n=1 Tax=Phytophthora aleatoria TaxID=2496075 RepID=A0A8J5IUJ5_9STRA|nr:hypothetical protein JG688_00002511 [Phytophthora aleatoria]